MSAGPTSPSPFVLTGAHRRGVSATLLPVGLVTGDEVIIVGTDGWIFLYRGSNDLIRLYDRTTIEPNVRDRWARWHELFDRRHALCQELRCQFIQYIIPEKSSIVPEHFPLNIQAPTPGLEAMEVSSRNYVVSARPLMMAHPRREALFLKTDSHCSEFGTYTMFRDIVLRISAGGVDAALTRLDECIGHFEPHLVAGFLGRALVNFPLYERALQLPPDLLKDLAPVEVERLEPKEGAHLGNRVVWRNANAPIQCKVVAFANSFFERGKSAIGLSWWFARFFSEFHFVWDPGMDEDYIRLVNPDVVLCQTIERFLSYVPKT